MAAQRYRVPDAAFGGFVEPDSFLPRPISEPGRAAANRRQAMTGHCVTAQGYAFLTRPLEVSWGQRGFLSLIDGRESIA